jgi:MFS family permease
MAMLGTIAYVPLFVQGVIGTSATSSGVVLTPLVLGAVTTSILSGQWVARTGRYRLNALVGPVILTAGMVLLWRMDVHTTDREAARNMIVAGVGIGSMMQVFVLSVQNVVRREAMGAATALTQFSRSIGATIGVTVMGVIVNQGLPTRLRENGEGATIHRLPPALRVDLANAIRPAFLAAAGIGVVLWVIAFLGVKQVPLRTGFEDATELAAVDASGAPR